MKKTFAAAFMMVVGSMTSFKALAVDTTDIGKICTKPKSKLYATDDMNKPLQMQMIVDYKTLNADAYSSTRQRGVVSIVTQDGQRETVPVLLSTRGQSRRQFCPARPLRMEFLDESIEKKIAQQLESEHQTEGTDDYMKRYLEILSKETIDTNTQIKGPKDNIFAGLGDDVKIVTHCGAAQWQYVGGANDDAQNEKLMSEFYVYQILATLNMPVEDTRLAKIDYRNPDGSKVYDGPRLAFFREPPTSLAKRCGLQTKPTPNGNVSYDSQISKVSAFQANFVDGFAVNNDFGLNGHNMNNLYDAQGDTFYGPYDFDLSGIFEPTYFKNQANLQDAFNSFMTKLNSYDRETALPTVQRTLSAKPEMQSVIDKANLSAARKKMFQTWLNMYMSGLEKYVSAK